MGHSYGEEDFVAIQAAYTKGARGTSPAEPEAWR